MNILSILIRVWSIFIFCLDFGILYAFSKDTYLDVTMPGYSPVEDEQYVCVAVEVTTPGYIVEFLPSATADRTHHMLAYGCNMPAHPAGQAWDCEHAAMCMGPQKILYAWARNAPPLALPPSVGVPIGKNENVGYIILQMHYARKFRGKVFDYSGVRLRIASEQPLYLAGIYLFVPSGDIPPNTETVFMNATCVYSQDAVVHPFAFRPHTHHLGRVVSAYKYSKDRTWSRIGKGNPQWPQRFYPVDDLSITIVSGDTLAAQCVYDSRGRADTTYLGSHGHDEMCNFYMYYYVDADHKSMMEQFSYCGLNQRNELFKEYPADASTRFAPNSEMEETAKQGDFSFSFMEKESWPISEIAFGQIAGLALDKKGNLVIFHRGDRVWGNMTFNLNNEFLEKDKGPIATETVVTIAEDGTMVSRWGRGLFYLPHGIFIDDNGFVWLTDVAMHQVFKFDMNSPGAKPLLTLGQQFSPGSDDKHFCKPAAVAVASGDEGAVFVADGYCNNRIMVFGPDGEFRRSWGEASQGKLSSGYPKLGTFLLPHALSLDDARRRVFVADRENGRVQIFSYDGTPLGQLISTDIGDTVYSVSFCPNSDTAFLVNGPAYTRMVDLRVSAFDGSSQRLMYSWQPSKGVLERPHAVLASKDCSHIFVGEIGPNKLWRFDITSSGRRASGGSLGKSDEKPQPHHEHAHMHDSHKPDTVSDDVRGGVKTLRTETENTLKLMLILFVAIAVPIIVIVAICCCVQCRRKGGYRRQNLLDSGFGKKSKGGLFADGFRDHKGFRPLSTEDMDASEDTDDSDAEHTLYLAHKNFGSRNA